MPCNHRCATLPAKGKIIHIRLVLPDGTIAYFGDKDKWKQGWDTAHAKWKSLGTETIELEIAPGRAHSFFNKDPWQTLTLLAADEFLVKHTLLNGMPTLKCRQAVRSWCPRHDLLHPTKKPKTDETHIIEEADEVVAGQDGLERLRFSKNSHIPC